MKQGRNYVELLEEIQRRANAKEDFLVPSGKARALVVREEDHRGEVVTHRNIPKLAFGDNEFGLTPTALSQLSEFAGIPRAYFDKMLEEQPDLWTGNVDTWLRAIGKTRMVRTLDGKVRAFLSDRYRPLENEDLASAVLPVLGELGVVIMSAQVTDDALYIKAVDERIKADVPTGRSIGDGSHVFFDTLSPAIVIRNSEVGKGRLAVETSTFTKVCTNLATLQKAGSIKKQHVGAKHDIFGEEEFTKLLSDETKRLNDAALWNTVRDVTRGMFEEQRFTALVRDEVAPAAERKIEGEVVEVVKVAAKRFGLTSTEGDSVLKRLIEAGSLTQYGLSNAITRASQDVADYDRASELERIGGDVITLPANDWKLLAKAA